MDASETVQPFCFVSVCFVPGRDRKKHAPILSALSLSRGKKTPQLRCRGKKISFFLARKRKEKRTKVKQNAASR
jgi:hypothetical protein